MSITQKIAIFVLILGLFLPFLGFCQESLPKPPIEIPKTIDEAINFIKNGVKIVLEKMPNILKMIWREEVLPIWQKMGDIFRNFWNNYIKNFLRNLWYSFLKPGVQFFIQKIKELLGKEIEIRKPMIEEEFQKEKEQMKEELPSTTKSYWQKFKDLLQ